MTLATLARYYHTLKYLRLRQWLGRAWIRGWRPTPDLRPAPPQRTPHAHWDLPFWHPPTVLDDNGRRFLFCAAGETHSVTTGHGPWAAKGASALWHYHLNYFSLSAETAMHSEACIARMRRWIADHPPGRGVAWDPYPCSLRIVNWLKVLMMGASLPPEVLQSLAVQGRWLRRRLEHHLLANHLLANAKALVFYGCVFDGREASAIRRHGERLLFQELPEQILPDGGHHERSGVYHRLTYEDLLDLLVLDRCHPGHIAPALIHAVRARLPGMLEWAIVMSHPDDDVSHFNDAAAGMAAPLAWLTESARHVGLTPPARPQAPAPGAVRVRHLADSGYVRAETATAVLLADLAPVGPDYQPGHAHADTLSFELSLFGERCIVNSGIDRYGTDAERARQRGTAAHSTVVVAGQDSSEVWGGFRVARRARPRDVWVDAAAGRFGACHDGYLRLRPGVLHRREWQLATGSLRVLDTLTGADGSALSAPVEAWAHFHLHPQVRLLARDAAHAVLACAGARVTIRPGGAWHLEQGSYHPALGVRQGCLTIKVRVVNCIATEFHWTGDEGGMHAYSLSH